MVDRVLLASPRGFCAGVEMAIKSLAWMLRMHEPPVYCYHEIVHNQLVVDRFRRLGVVFVDSIDEVPAGAPLMLSAHGSAPEVVEAGRQRAGFLVNAVCPLVTKVHHEAKVRAQRGYQILYVGHRGHDEAVGALAVAPESMHLVEGPDDVAILAGDGPLANQAPVALLAQTTLAQQEWADILAAAEQRWPELWTAGRSDLCFATTNRQAALIEIARRSDAVVVIGSANSSNTLALAKVAQSAGAQTVLRIDSPAELPADLAGTVGVTAGASAPDELVRAVIAHLNPREGVEEVSVTPEDEYFPLPRELRDLLGGVERLIALLAGAPVSALPSDRSLPASEVLESLRA